MLFSRSLFHALRIARRNPWFAVSAIAVMALGVGAATAVFSVVRGVLLTPLPYREPNRIVLFRADAPGYVRQAALNREELWALRERSDLFESVAVMNESDGNVTAPDPMEAVVAASASDNFIETLGVPLALGRMVSRQDIGKPYVTAVTISYELWERRFGLDPEAVGRPIEVNNLPMRIVGVLPKHFRLYLGPGVISPHVDVWFPRPRSYDEEAFRGRIVIARLRRDVSLETARAAVDTLAAQLVAQHPSVYATGQLRLTLSSLDHEVVSGVRPALTTLSGAVGFVLLIACANLANLLLARASARGRELAVRVSIGASRGQIVSHLVAEGVLLGVLGAAGGVLIAHWCVDGLLLLAPATLPRREAISVDAIAAAFAIVTAVACAVAASLVPAYHATRIDAISALKRDPVSSRGAGRIRGALSAGQLALSVVLLVGAALMGRAFVGLRSVPLGFDPDSALTMGIALQNQRFNRGSLDEARAIRLRFYQQLADEVRQIPGVEQVGIGMPVPLKGVSLVQHFSAESDGIERQAEVVIALAGYLEALRVPLVAGRYFSRADDTQPMVIVDERLAGQVWPGQSAVGRRLALLSPIGPPRSVEIVGVAAHTQMQSLRYDGLPQIWVTYGSKAYSGLDLVVRSSNPAALIEPVKEAVQRLGAGRPVHDVRLLSEYVAAASADTRFALFVLGAFAGFAVTLTVIGVYAVVAYATARRTREIAVRLALGGDARHIVMLVMRQGTPWIVGGLVTGIAGARVLTGYVSGLLFKVSEADLVTFGVVACGLAAVAIVATGIPALRAVRIDPMLSLKSE
jgi:putative ABC transport system permease protein